jgi:hypothetical protein
VQDDPRSGQSKTQRPDASVDRVRTLVRSDQILGVRLIAEELNMNRETVQQIIAEDLGTRKTSANMSATDYCKGFGNEKNFRKHGASNLNR